MTEDISENSQVNVKRRRRRRRKWLMQVAKSHVQTRNYSLFASSSHFFHISISTTGFLFFIGTIVYDGGGSRHNKQFFVPPCVFHEWTCVSQMLPSSSSRLGRCNNNNNCGLLALNMVDWIMRGEKTSQTMFATSITFHHHNIMSTN